MYEMSPWVSAPPQRLGWHLLFWAGCLGTGVGARIAAGPPRSDGQTSAPIAAASAAGDNVDSEPEADSSAESLYNDDSLGRSPENQVRWDKLYQAGVDLTSRRMDYALILDPARSHAFLQAEHDWDENIFLDKCGMSLETDFLLDEELDCAIDLRVARGDSISALVMAAQHAAASADEGGHAEAPGDQNVPRNPDVAQIPALQEPVLTSEGPTTPAVLLDGISPVYPDSLRARGVEGVVILDFVVGTDGRVEKGTIQIQSSSNQAFVDSAIAAVRRARFSSALLRGRPVRSPVRQEVRFTLSGTRP